MKAIGQFKNKSLVILIFIVLLGGILRLWNLDKYPVGFTPDEASFGYDAYSLLQTGKDQWGHSWPIVLESFGDYKAPLFTYLMIPSVAALGLSKVSVRLPNALVGVFAIVVVYLLVKALFKAKGSALGLKAEAVALSSALLLAINPWHVMMSRGGFEANLTTLFLPLGVLFIIKGFEKNRYLYLGMLILGLNMFSYHAAKLVTPGVIVVLFFLFREKLSSIAKKPLIISSGIFSVFLLVTIYTFSIGAGARVSDVSIFKGITDASAQSKVDAYAMGVNPFLTRVLYSKFEIPVSRFLENYVSYFSPQYLFTKGPSEATYGMIPGRGVIYWFELPFLLGFLASLFKAKDKRLHLFALGWLLIAPIPSALTTGAGYAGNRAENMLPALQIILAVGFVEVYDYLKNKLNKPIFNLTTLSYRIFAVILVTGFLADYFFVSPVRNAHAMLSGNLEAANYLANEIPSDANIIVSRSLSEPQIYIAFANVWDPTDYQNATKNWNYKKLGVDWVDQIPDYRLGNYNFKGINIDEYKIDRGAYVVGRPGEFPDDVKITKTINYPSGDAAIIVVKSSDLVTFAR